MDSKTTKKQVTPIGVRPNEDEMQIIQQALQLSKQKKIAPFVLSMALEGIEKHYPHLFQKS